MSKHAAAAAAPTAMPDIPQPGAVSASMSDDQVESLYAYGHGLFTTKQYPQALQVLTLAMMLRPKTMHYMIATGLAHRMMGHDAAALDVFQMAVMLHPSRLEPRVHLADCALMSGDTGLALDAARVALGCAAQGGTFETELRQRAKLILERGSRASRPAAPVSAAVQ